MDITKMIKAVEKRLGETQNLNGRKALQRFLSELKILEEILDFDPVTYTSSREEVEKKCGGKKNCYLNGDYIVISTTIGKYQREWYAYVTPIDNVSRWWPIRQIQHKKTPAHLLGFFHFMWTKGHGDGSDFQISCFWKVSPKTLVTLIQVLFSNLHNNIK